MKKLAKKLVAAILGSQVKKLYKKNKFQVVAVAGSVGKTTTKIAIANVLAAKYKVQYQDGNYNDLVTVPLIFFGEETPSLHNPLTWLGVFLRNRKKIKQQYPYDVVVVEVGTDSPGQIRQFASYLRIDIAVLTGITAEHMQFFANLDEVAKEELDITSMSTNLVFNKELVSEKYLKTVALSKISYGIRQPADFQAVNITYEDDKCSFEVLRAGKPFLSSSNDLVSEPQLYSVSAAVAVASQLGMNAEEINSGLSKLHPVNGRMQRLRGINDSIIIDDTYNASPEATKAALETLYRLEAPYKIAVLGNMNELGRYSQELHEEIGIHCDSDKLDLVITIGPDANEYLARVAETRGCKVEKFDNPYKAGEYLKGVVQQNSAILVKGSQNGVFAEETVKLLLADKNDAGKLVRQDLYWMKIKQKAFHQ